MNTADAAAYLGISRSRLSQEKSALGLVTKTINRETHYTAAQIVEIAQWRERKANVMKKIRMPTNPDRWSRPGCTYDEPCIRCACEIVHGNARETNE